MLLCIDIGNTNTTFGIFDKDTLIQKFTLPSDKNFSQNRFEGLIKNSINNIEKVDSCCIASVVNELTPIIKGSCDKIFNTKTVIITNDFDFGITLDVDTPESVGIDRIANVCEAQKYGSPVIVIDMGSATTFDILSSDKRFFGGIIMPGIKLQLKSLYISTSKLPKIEPEEIDKVVGNTTKTCILSGVIRGTACAIDGLIEECEKEMNTKAIIIGTGGFSQLISKYTKRVFDYVEPNLTLCGIKDIYYLNI